MGLHSLLFTVQQSLAWAPAWVFSLVVLAAALLFALAVHALLVRLVRRGLRDKDVFWRSLVVRTRDPGRLAMVFLALDGGTLAAPLSDGLASLVRHGLLIAAILMAGWILLTALDIAAAIYLRRYKVEVEDNLLARKHLTQVRILRRALATLVIVVTVALALMTIPAVRQWGVSLLAAGGAAGILVGLALQPLLSNLMAGIQIAVTQPIRMDDGVLVENEYGNVEEITATYVVVRLWDQRRMVLPLTYFLQKPFQNWTRESAELIGTVMLYLDYATPVEPLRAKLTEVLKGSRLWDGRVANLAVTDARERTMEVRCLVSARNSGDTFDLRCEVREKLIAWLQAELPQALPRDRVELNAAAPQEDASSGQQAPGRIERPSPVARPQ